MDNTTSRDSLNTLQIVMAPDDESIPIPFGRIAEIRSVADIQAMTGSERNAGTS